MAKADGLPANRGLGFAHPRRGRSAGTLFLQVVNLECSFLGRSTQSPLDTLLHSWHEDLVPELLPAFLGVVHGHDRPAARRGTGGVEDLAGWEAAPVWMDRCKRFLVLVLRTARKVMHDRVGHGWSPPDRVCRFSELASEQ